MLERILNKMVTLLHSCDIGWTVEMDLLWWTRVKLSTYVNRLSFNQVWVWVWPLNWIMLLLVHKSWVRHILRPGRIVLLKGYTRLGHLLRDLRRWELLRTILVGQDRVLRGCKLYIMEVCIALTLDNVLLRSQLWLELNIHLLKWQLISWAEPWLIHLVNIFLVFPSFKSTRLLLEIRQLSWFRSFPILPTTLASPFFIELEIQYTSSLFSLLSQILTLIGLWIAPWP
jgi:hypothetical protein